MNRSIEPARANRWARLAVCLAAAGVLLSAAPASAKTLKKYQSKYYQVFSDLDEADVREAIIRMNAMAEEYHDRTKGFSGEIRAKLPFYMYSNMADYQADGGMPGSAGQFDGRRLMAVAGKDTSAWTWHVIQHEGFHQFVIAVIGGGVPIWVNEGLAEYFGSSVFTGENYVSGVIPPTRLKGIKAMLKAGRFPPLEDMMKLSHQEWNARLNVTNYDQAWAMVQFLGQAENGKYQDGFGRFIKIAGARGDWKRPWKDIFGKDIDAFQRRWSDWWLALPDNPTADLYGKAVMTTMVAFFGRAWSQDQKFQTMDEFFKAAADPKALKANPQDWLPPSLLEENLPKAKTLGDWQIVADPAKPGPPQITCQFKSGTVFCGQFFVNAKRVTKVSVKPQAPTSQPATQPDRKP